MMAGATAGAAGKCSEVGRQIRRQRLSCSCFVSFYHCGLAARFIYVWPVPVAIADLAPDEDIASLARRVL
jgi:hypothetical protein